MKRFLILSCIVACLGGCSVVGSQVSEPNWKRISKDGDIDVRQYDPMIVAEVTTEGERYTAINDGFRILAGYIFGKNKTKQSISMTAPVIQQSTQNDGQKEGSQKIAMTAPVMQEAGENNTTWTVRFVMPEEYTLETLPTPIDPRIRLKQVQAAQVAAITFTGMNTDNNLAEHRKKLESWIRAKNMQSVGDPLYAFYNPPWTLPFLRRNEVIIRLSKTD